MELLLIAAVGAAITFYIQLNRAKKQTARALSAANQAKQSSDQRIGELEDEVESLGRFREIRDATAAAEQLRQTTRDLKASAAAEAQAIRAAAEQEAAEIRAAAEEEAKEIRRSSTADAKARNEKSQAILTNANQQAAQIIEAANQRAEQIAGDAYRALKDGEHLTRVATAMKNVIEGYGDRYLKPTYSLLDELADAYGFNEAGQQLKQARERSQLMVTHHRAAICDYVEKNRRETATRFVVDAFNGKVDSILSRSKADNFGTLEQQIRDAFALVNNNGAAFRNASITEDYLDARLSELKWAVAVQALRDREREEQRRIREQMREEEKARREIARALKEAGREEEALQKAMEKVQAQAAKANAAQRAEFSMAQQTKAGHVYVISNVGSFGEGMVKIGMTRRLEPLDRIRELGDASVPFNFDVHAMIWSEDAPGLERELHRRFVRHQVNKVNPRKEFFQVSLGDLRSQVEELGMEATWTMTAMATEYQESLAMADRLRDNPAMAEEWLRHQLDCDPVGEMALEANGNGAES
jgi:F0F1-type ATP synthase membrane subunit b/b'